jgi:hypothetical protein
MGRRLELGETVGQRRALNRGNLTASLLKIQYASARSHCSVTQDVDQIDAPSERCSYGVECWRG